MPKTTLTQNSPPALSVSELNRKARQLLEMHLNLVWVEGELTNFATPSSGHWYFSLKDASAQVRCAMFKPLNNRVGFKPKEGTLVRVRAKVSLYEGRGDYQLIIESLEDAGIGALQRAFDALKKKLAEEGLFNEEFKQPLPSYPKHIGVITSPTGAAIHDIVTVLKRRYPIATVTVIPVAVQGKQAAGEIATAITRANLLNGNRLKENDGLEPFDVLIVGRGGGSLEDLWAFNEEIVARAIFASEIPIVSAVGHEIDFSIADFVADVRAATPSAAAELITPDRRELLAEIIDYQNFFLRSIQQRLREWQQALRLFHSQLKHPGQALQEQVQHLDHLEIRLYKSFLATLSHTESKIQNLTVRLQGQSPSEKIKWLHKHVFGINQQIKHQSTVFYQEKQQKLSTLSQLLHSVSPLNTLNRGYAIVSNAQNAVVQSTHGVKVGDRINTRLKNGSLDCEVAKINK